MVKYISDKFSEYRGFREFAEVEPRYTSDLLGSIAKKSSGVFLWVTVAVASLLAGVLDGDCREGIQSRLEELPPDLEGLFERIFDSIEAHHKAEAAKIFRLVYAVREPLTLLQRCFADQYHVEAVLKLGLDRPKEVPEGAGAQWMRRQVNSYCKGLLEAVSEDVEKREK
jgi:hypothetical protein